MSRRINEPARTRRPLETISAPPSEVPSPEENAAQPHVRVSSYAMAPHAAPGFTWVLLRAEQVGGALPATAYASPSVDPATMDLGPSSTAGIVSAWVLLPAEAKARGFKNTLSFRRWCRRHGVLVRRDEGGRMLWVNRRDIDRAIEGLPARGEREIVEEASRSVADFLVRAGAR